MFLRYFKLFLIIILFLFASQILSYDTYIAHPKLTNSAIKIYNNQTEKKINKEQEDWIITGSTNEDTFPRYLNHFYNPTTNKGLDDGGFSGITAKQWAKNQDNVASGDYSIPTILENYKQGNLKRAYQGIGHILHLIQDMSVPAHTRNDIHINGDPYEEWAKENGNVNINKVNFINVNNLDQVFDDLAKYSNNSFFSKDTIDNSIINKIQEYKTEKDFNGDDIVYGYYNGYRIIKTKKDLNKIKYQFDFRVHLDYWNMLHPKAVGYSAGTIDYFIKQFEQIDKEKQQQLSLKNKINKILTKTLSNVKYSWGDVFFTNLTKAEKIYSASKNITNNIKQNIGFFNQANKEIAEQGVKVITKIIQKTAENIINPPIKFEQLLKPLTAEESEDKKLNENIVKKVVNQKQIPILVESKGGLTNSAKLNAITIVELPKINNIIIEQEKISEQKEVEIFVKPKLSNFILVSNNNNIPPDTTIINSIDNISSSTSASFVFHSSEQDNTFECNLDEQGWHVCTQEYNLINLSENIHNLKVRAIDVNGNVDPISSVFNWTIDITAPTISIINHPAIFASSTTANFQFISDDDNTIYQYKLDNSDWQLCSASTSIADLIEGQHSLKIRGLDQMSNIGSSTIYTWLVDLTMPTSAIINMVATNDAINFNVNWNGEDINGVNDYDIQYKINNNDWQEWINNIISTSTIFNIAIVDEQTIYFRSRAKDNAGNIGEWSVIVQTKISNHIANHVVISEFATRGLTSATDEFIELYNPTDQIIDLTNWKLQFKPINEENWIDCVDGLGLSSSTAIAAKGYYLIVTVDYSLSTAPDYRHNINWELANNGGHIRILNSNNIEIDKVGYGLADNPETSAFIVDFSANTSLERKSFATSTAGTMDINGIHENSGNGYDSNNNSNDFIISNDPFPQSSNDSTEPLGDIELC